MTFLKRLEKTPWLAEAGAALLGLVYAGWGLFFAHTSNTLLDEGAYLYKGWLFATGRYSSPGCAMVEQSEDIYSAFSEVAQATGGISESSANAAAAFEKAVNASENYYLIYYAPKNYKADGKFHKIMVKVKAGGYAVTHRAGYIAT